MQTKSFATKFDTTSEGEFHGYASVFGNRDSYGDVVDKGAFARTLNNDRGRIKVLWQHNPSNPIGVPLEMAEDDHGLHVKARIARTALGRDAIELMRAGVVTELSIGYDTLQDEYNEASDTRHLKEIKLFEFSPVTWAANELAKINAVKNAGDLDLILDHLERLKWAGGRLESDRLRSRVKGAISSLDRLLTDQTPPPPVAPPSGTPQPTGKDAPDPVHAPMAALSAFKSSILATAVQSELRAFGETLRSNE